MHVETSPRKGDIYNHDPSQGDRRDGLARADGKNRMNEAKAIQRPEELQKILFKDRGDEVIEAIFSAELNNIINRRGEPNAVITHMMNMIKYVLKLIGVPKSVKSMMIADVVSVWGIAYPSCLSNIISCIENDLIENFDSKLFIEGAMIGLFEALNLGFNNEAEMDLFKLFKDGQILIAMDTAEPTKEGRGRLNNALSTFTALAWGGISYADERKAKIALGVKLLGNWLVRAHPDKFKDLIQSLKLRDENFLAYFSWQLAHMLAVNGPTVVMFSCKYAGEREMESWKAQFPELLPDAPRSAVPAA